MPEKVGDFINRLKQEHRKTNPRKPYEKPETAKLEQPNEKIPGYKILEQIKATAGKEFKKVLAHKFEYAVPGNFETRIPNINMTVAPAKETITIIPFYTDEKNTERHTTVKILSDGSLLPEQRGGLDPTLIQQLLVSMPNLKNLHPRLQNEAALQELLIEACRIEKLMHLDKRVILPESIKAKLAGQKILAPGEFEQLGISSGTKSKREKKPVAILPERIDFMCQIPGLIKRLDPDIRTRVNYGKGYGTGYPHHLSDYFAFLWPNKAVLENAVAENAVYIIPFKEPIPAAVIKVSQEGNDAPLIDFLDKTGFLKQLAEVSKQELMSAGMRYGSHPRSDTKPEKMEAWQAGLQRRILERNT